MCVCNINIAVLFLMLASVTTMAVDGELDDSMTMLLSWHAWFLSSFCLLCKLNTIQSEKLSITLWPGESLKWREEKERKIPLILLSMSTMWLLMRDRWQLVRDLREFGYWGKDPLLDKSIRDHMRWLGGSECARSCDLPPSFWRCSLMGINPMMASMLSVGEILKAPRI